MNVENLNVYWQTDNKWVNKVARYKNHLYLHMLTKIVAYVVFKNDNTEYKKLNM